MAMGTILPDNPAAECHQAEVGQLRPLVNFGKLPSKRQLYFGTCPMANSNVSARVAVQLAGRFSRQ